MTSDQDYMRMAIAEAIEAQRHGELPIGAVVVSSNGIVARNRCREAAEKTVLAHAELHALNDACRALGTNRLDDCTIYCTNEPCLMCASAIFQARLRRVVYGVSRNDLPRFFRPRRLHIEDLAADSGYGPIVDKGVLADEIMHLFDGIARPSGR